MLICESYPGELFTLNKSPFWLFTDSNVFKVLSIENHFPNRDTTSMLLLTATKKQLRYHSYPAQQLSHSTHYLISSFQIRLDLRNSVEMIYPIETMLDVSEVPAAVTIAF